MKLQRRTKTPSLWGWLKPKLPRAFVARAVTCGYGQMCCIYVAGTEPGLLGRLFDVVGNPAAVVDEQELELHEPQYLSDFQDLLSAYEAETKTTVTLTYWEAP